MMNSCFRRPRFDAPPVEAKGKKKKKLLVGLSVSFKRAFATCDPPCPLFRADEKATERREMNSPAAQSPPLLPSLVELKCPPRIMTVGLPSCKMGGGEAVLGARP